METWIKSPAITRQSDTDGISEDGDSNSRNGVRRRKKNDMIQDGMSEFLVCVQYDNGHGVILVIWLKTGAWLEYDESMRYLGDHEGVLFP